MVRPEGERPASLWEKLRLVKPKVAALPIPAPVEQTARLAGESLSWLYSDREMVAWHLKAHPQEQNSIIAGYLQSPELLQDENTFADFLAFWLEEFLQQPEAGPMENLPKFIKEVDPNQLSRKLQKARKDIFLPLFKRLAGKEEKLFPPGPPAGRTGEEIDLSQVCHEFAKTIFDLEQPLPESLKEEYLAYVKDLIEKESGIAPRLGLPSEAKPEKAKRRGMPFPPNPEITKPRPEPFSLPDKKFLIVLGPGPQTKRVPINDLETLRQAMKKIKSLGPISPKDVWRRLERLRTLKPEELSEVYKERVAGGKFMGWSKIPIGLKWWILFQFQDGQIFFRVGSHEDVYATDRRKPRDKSRSL